MYPFSAERQGIRMLFNMNNKKNRRIISAVIILLLVLAMILPTLTYILL